jgi:hypothetical protein
MTIVPPKKRKKHKRERHLTHRQALDLKQECLTAKLTAMLSEQAAIVAKQDVQILLYQALATIEELKNTPPVDITDK